MLPVWPIQVSVHEDHWGKSGNTTTGDQIETEKGGGDQSN